ncbi:MAG: ethanolamine ammonia-lyase light chain EutC [Hyphomicrobium sp.]
MAHAKARDAVHRPLDLHAFRSLDPVMLQSAAPDRATYLRRPILAEGSPRIRPRGLRPAVGTQ